MNKIICLNLLLCTPIKLHSSAADSGSLNKLANDAKNSKKRKASETTVIATATFKRVAPSLDFEEIEGYTKITIKLPNQITIGKRITSRGETQWAKKEKVLQNLDMKKYADNLPLFGLIENHCGQKDHRTFLCIPYGSNHAVTRRYTILSNNTFILTSDSDNTKGR